MCHCVRGARSLCVLCVTDNIHIIRMAAAKFSTPSCRTQTPLNSSRNRIRRQNWTRVSLMAAMRRLMVLLLPLGACLLLTFRAVSPASRSVANRALELLQRGQSDQALALLQTAPASDVRSQVSLAVAALQVQRYALAKRVSKRLLSSRRQSPATKDILRPILGTALFELGEYRASSGVLKKAISSNRQTDLSTLVSLAKALQAQNKTRLAGRRVFDFCKSGSRNLPDAKAAECFEMAGVFFSKAGDRDSAIQAFDLSLASQPRLIPYFSAGAMDPLLAKVKSIPNAIHDEPMILVVDDFLNLEARELYIAALQTTASATMSSGLPPLVCFDTSHPSRRTVLRDLQRKHKGRFTSDHRLCANSSDLSAETLAGLRWSSSTFAYADETAPWVRDLERLIEKQFGLSPELAFSTQLLEYNTNGVAYAAHTDCTHRLKRHERAVTVLIYLTTPDGGATAFPRLNISVDSVAGRAVVFTSLDDRGFCDPRSLHESLPVLPSSDVNKMVIQKWYSRDTQDATHSHHHSSTASEITVPGQSYVSCDGSSSCRQFMPFAAPTVQTDL